MRVLALRNVAMGCFLMNLGDRTNGSWCPQSLCLLACMRASLFSNEPQQWPCVLLDTSQLCADRARIVKGYPSNEPRGLWLSRKSMVYGC
jgi:hypothetical protein